MILVALIPVGAVIINNINGNGVITKDESSDLEPVSLIELVIPSTSNSGVPFTATEDATYKFEIKGGKYCTQPELCRSVIHGYLDREIDWQLLHDIPHPVEPNYEIGCWENDVLTNPNCGKGHVAIFPMKAQQTIIWVAVDDQKSYGGNEGEIVLSISKN